MMMELILRKGNQVNKLCPICNKKYIGKENQIYCSCKCSSQSPNHYKVYNDTKAKIKRLKTYNKIIKLRKGNDYQVGKIDIECLICGKKVKRYRDSGIPKFCSRKCWIEYLKKNPNLPNLLGGKNSGFKKGNTFWRTNGHSKYHKGWIKLGNKKYWYDSSFEKEAMKIMFIKKIKFIRDYKVDLGKSIIFIDFYLPKYKKFVEAKGYFRKDSKQKIKKFEKLYHQKIDVIQAQYTKDFCIKFKNYLEAL
jgi:hypothetical protein